MCRYDVMYVTRSVRQKEKIKKEKIIKYIGGERKAFVDRGHETGGRILKVVVSLRRTFARDQILREKQRPRRSERPRSCCCESTFREQNPATIRDRDRANICIYTEW